MSGELEALRARMEQIDGLLILAREPLSGHTRFAIGGPADLLISADSKESFSLALKSAQELRVPWIVIGEGSNLVVSDSGYPGVVFKLATAGIQHFGNRVEVDSGAVLQDLVDFTIGCGLRGLETMTGIPGWVGAAVYGNAGAYGHSIEEHVECVQFFDGAEFRSIGRQGCGFRYRDSIFKRQKAWIVTSCTLSMESGNGSELRAKADSIRKVRDEKYPPSMKCAGSIFKNLIFSELPLSVQSVVPQGVIREGKVPSAWFLEQVGAKGMRIGDIQVASYHANLIYNDGEGTARDLLRVISLLKKLVQDRFQMDVEEEVQYVGEIAA